MKSVQGNNKGFTLIELMIVVVIIGILAALAIPRFMQATTKTKQSEAQLILKQVYVNQRAYRQENMVNQYYLPAGPADSINQNAFSTIWVEIMDGCKYQFTINGTPNTFTCTAVGNIDDDAVMDTWTIDQDGNIQNTINDVTAS